MNTQDHCSLGAGCDEAGVCYANAQGEPDRCPRNTNSDHSTTRAGEGAKTALLPCPFCGSAARYLGGKPGFWTTRVICDNCSFHLPPFMWNRRVPLAASQPPNELVLSHQRLKDALAGLMVGCEYHSIGGDEPMWHRLQMPNRHALDRAREALEAAP